MDHDSKPMILSGRVLPNPASLADVLAFGQTVEPLKLIGSLVAGAAYRSEFIHGGAFTEPFDQVGLHTPSILGSPRRGS